MYAIINSLINLIIIFINLIMHSLNWPIGWLCRTKDIYLFGHSFNHSSIIIVSCCLGRNRIGIVVFGSFWSWTNYCSFCLSRKQFANWVLYYFSKHAFVFFCHFIHQKLMTLWYHSLGHASVIILIKLTHCLLCNMGHPLWVEKLIIVYIVCHVIQTSPLGTLTIYMFSNFISNIIIIFLFLLVLVWLIPAPISKIIIFI